MHEYYKLDGQVIINIIHRHIKPTEPPKQNKKKKPHYLLY